MVRTRYFNIFHPMDPVAYRIEPLIAEEPIAVKGTSGGFLDAVRPPQGHGTSHFFLHHLCTMGLAGDKAPATHVSASYDCCIDLLSIFCIAFDDLSTNKNLVMTKETNVVSPSHQDTMKCLISVAVIHLLCATWKLVSAS